jgi:hypothetical protein
MGVIDNSLKKIKLISEEKENNSINLYLNES